MATILNVDDDAASRYLVGSILRRAGFKCLEADSGSEALRLVRERPDLVLLDVNLPDINGFEVCRQLKEDPLTSFIPVVHISASNIDSADAVHGLEGGADGYLTHPVNPNVLIATINAFLRIRKAESQWQITFDSIHDGICILDSSGNIVKSNRALQALLDLGPRSLKGQNLESLLRSRSQNYNRKEDSTDFELNEKSFQLTSREVSNGESEPSGTVVVISDDTERKAAEQATISSLKLQEMAVQEIHHRVKNNLQVVLSLLNLQKEKVKDSETLSVLEEGGSRIKAIALIHETLYSTSSSSVVDMKAYFRQLGASLVESYSLGENVNLQYHADDIHVDHARAMPLGLILNELISNALKYAFSSETKGEITVALKKIADDKIEMVVADNGKGIEDIHSLNTSKCLGWRLVNLLVGQIGGTLEFLDASPGAHIRIVFSEK